VAEGLAVWTTTGGLLSLSLGLLPTPGYGEADTVTAVVLEVTTLGQAAAAATATASIKKSGYPLPVVQIQAAHPPAVVEARLGARLEGYAFLDDSCKFGTPALPEMEFSWRLARDDPAPAGCGAPVGDETAFGPARDYIVPGLLPGPYSATLQGRVKGGAATAVNADAVLVRVPTPALALVVGGGSTRTVASTEALTLAAELQEAECVAYTYTWASDCAACAVAPASKLGKALAVTGFGGAASASFTVTVAMGGSVI
jgi:hypothetical protein